MPSPPAKVGVLSTGSDVSQGHAKTLQYVIWELSGFFINRSVYSSEEHLFTYKLYLNSTFLF